MRPDTSTRIGSLGRHVGERRPGEVELHDLPVGLTESAHPLSAELRHPDAVAVSQPIKSKDTTRRAPGIPPPATADRLARHWQGDQTQREAQGRA